MLNAGGTRLAPGARRAVSRLAPRGWRDFWLQVVLLGSFEVVYALSGIYGRNHAAQAVANSRHVLNLEQRLGIAWERGLQEWALRQPSHLAVTVANDAYFVCQLAVSSAFLLWVYVRRAEHFARVRNAILAVNCVSIAVLFAYPVAPPRMLSGAGLADTMRTNTVNLQSPLIDALNNPYSAMPSLHASYAIVLGIAGVALTRRWWLRAMWAAYPAVVIFSVVASGNHFVLDVAAGAAAIVAVPVVEGAALLGARMLDRRRGPARPDVGGRAA
ncbi:MAG: phosphatase PAP2 family protein [Gaiellales bacterium]